MTWVGATVMHNARPTAPLAAPTAEGVAADVQEGTRFTRFGSMQAHVRPDLSQPVAMPVESVTEDGDGDGG